MIGSKVEIEFRGSVNNGDVIELLFNGNINLDFKFSRTRTYRGDVLIPTESDPNFILLAIAFEEVVNLDYNKNNEFTVVRVDNIVTIETKSENAGFELINNTNPNINILITEPIQIFSIDNVDIGAGSDCDHVELEITTNIQAEKLLSPISQNVSTNPFSIEIERASPINKNNPSPIQTLNITNLKARALSIYIAEESVLTPVKLLPSAVKIEMDNSPAGSTAVVKVDSRGLDLEFLLDTGSWQQESVFSGIAEGPHTIYIRDQFGCTIEKEFSAGVSKPSEPLLYVSEALSNRFVPEVDFDICSPYRNEKNTLSCDEDVVKAWKEVQTFQKCDILTVQIKSNYDNNRAILRQIPTGNSQNLVMQKVTDNIGRRDMRDAEPTIVLDSGGPGKLGIYFTDGDIYDYDSGAVIGDYTLNGGLPIWGKKGNWVSVELGSGPVWLKIEEVRYVEDVNALVLILGNINTQFINTIVVRSLFNIEDYEVYERSFDLSNMDGRAQFTIESSDVIFGNKSYISEEIEIKTFWKNTSHIIYWNKDNSDIMYSTGIKNQLRVGVERATGGFEDNTDDQRTDDSVRLINEQLYQTQTFEFSLVTTGMMRKLVIALSHTHVFINDMRFVKQEIEVERVSQNSNLYNVTATMIFADESFSTGQYSQDPIDIEIPNLIKNDNGSYVKYS